MAKSKHSKKPSTKTFDSSDSETEKPTKTEEMSTDEGIDDKINDRDAIRVETRPIPDSVSDEVKANLKNMGINSLFEVQYKTIDMAMNGDDMIIQARTGSGKTLGFALPTVERLVQSDIKIRPNQPRVLAMAPTRELAGQICKVFNQICAGLKYEAISIYGGSSYEEQRRQLNSGKAAIVVGTPGRIKDLADGGSLDLSKCKICILDEVDRMLDMGFSEIVEEILSCCPYPKKGETSSKKPQTLFFSATCPEWVEEHAKTYMTKDIQRLKLVDDAKVSGLSETVEHLCVQIDRFSAVATCVRDLVRLYSAGRTNGRAIVFTQTKKEANDLALGEIAIGDAQVMHGDIEQKQREVTLKGFREGKFRCLVATDVAARGLDIPQIDLVLCTSPPSNNDIESYVHRSGRTGRAGKAGVSCCIYNFKNKYLIKNVEKETGIKFREIPVPQPVDVARSVIKEKLQDDMKATIHDPRQVYENFLDIARDVIDMCDTNKDEKSEKSKKSKKSDEDETSSDPKEATAAERAVACLITYIAQGDAELKARSLISGQEGLQTWMIEADQSNGHPMGLVRNSLGKQQIPYEAIEKITDWRECVEASSLGGYAVVFDLPGKFTKDIIALWEENEVRSCGRENCLLKRVETELPELKGFKSSGGGKFGGGGGRGGGRGRGRGSGRGGFRGGNRDGGFSGQKRSYGDRDGGSRGRGRGGFQKRFKNDY